jgi:DNA-binding transcriptional MocR family regulator
MHLVAELAPGLDESEIVARCAARQISVSALSSYYLGDAPRSGLLLGYACADESEIRIGVERLAGAL